MDKSDTVIATFPDHNSADTAIKNLTAAGIEMSNLSVVGKGQAGLGAVGARVGGRVSLRQYFASCFG